MFFGPGATETFVKLRRRSDATVTSKPFALAQPVSLTDITSKDQFQLICFENNNAAFFADTVVLVEGDSDYLLMPHVARTLNAAWDVAKLPLLFVRMTGKGNIRRYRGFFERFGIRVPVIADLDLLVNGFEHISPSSAIRSARENLLRRVDELAAPDKDGPSSKEAKEAHESGELRGLWRRVKEFGARFGAGRCSQAEHDEVVEAFFAWQRKSERLSVLKSSSDGPLLELKYRLLEMLRSVDVYVLERGAIEDYYPSTITGADKPSRAQDFCSKVTTREALLECCGEQHVERKGRPASVREFDLIFKGILGGPPAGEHMTEEASSSRS